jgi:hypothetical protein
MLMPPQQPQDPQQDPYAPPPITPGPGGNLDPNYGFIFNGQQPQQQQQQQPSDGGRFYLPQGRHFGFPKKPLMVVLLGIVVLIILIPVLSGMFLKRGVNKAELIAVMGRGQEIARVSKIVEQKSSDQNIKNIAATTQDALISDQNEMIKYLSTRKIKVGPKQLGIYADRKVDGNIDVSIQTNTLSTTYITYLKSQLSQYENAIKTASIKAPIKAREVLQVDLANAETLLQSQPLSSATN